MSGPTVSSWVCEHPCIACAIAQYETSTRPISWVRTHLLGWPTVLPPHEAQTRPAGASAYGADVEGVI